MAGKGSRYRPVNKKKFDENYERIFGKQDFPKNNMVTRKVVRKDLENKVPKNCEVDDAR